MQDAYGLFRHLDPNTSYEAAIKVNSKRARSVAKIMCDGIPRTDAVIAREMTSRWGYPEEGSSARHGRKQLEAHGYLRVFDVVPGPNGRNMQRYVWTGEGNPDNKPIIG